MIIAILILLASMCIIDIVYINKKIYSPIFVFNAIWLITLGLYELKLSTLQQDLSNRTIFIFLICIVSYNITCLVKLLLNIKNIKINRMKPFINKEKVKEKIFNYTIIKKILAKNYTIEDKVKIGKYIVLIIFVIQTIYSRGLPLIWKLTGSSKVYIDYGIPSLTGAWYGLIICLGAYSFFKKGLDKYIYILIRYINTIKTNSNIYNIRSYFLYYT